MLEMLSAGIARPGGLQPWEQSWLSKALGLQPGGQGVAGTLFSRGSEAMSRLVGIITTSAASSHKVRLLREEKQLTRGLEGPWTFASLGPVSASGCRVERCVARGG